MPSGSIHSVRCPLVGPPGSRPSRSRSSSHRARQRGTRRHSLRPAERALETRVRLRPEPERRLRRAEDAFADVKKSRAQERGQAGGRQRRLQDAARVHQGDPVEDRLEHDAVRVRRAANRSAPRMDTGELGDGARLGRSDAPGRSAVGRRLLRRAVEGRSRSRGGLPRAHEGRELRLAARCGARRPKR